MSSINYLDKTGLGTLWGKIKALIPTKTSDLTNDAGYTTNEGTVTGVEVNGTTYQPTSGVADIGNLTLVQIERW